MTGRLGLSELVEGIINARTSDRPIGSEYRAHMRLRSFFALEGGGRVLMLISGLHPGPIGG